jgi:hypothetical protein
VNGHFLLETAVQHIPLVDMRLTEFDLEFLRNCGIMPDVFADWRPEGVKEGM